MMLGAALVNEIRLALESQDPQPSRDALASVAEVLGISYTDPDCCETCGSRDGGHYDGCRKLDY
jgi:hypothetical protein